MQNQLKQDALKKLNVAFKQQLKNAKDSVHEAVDSYLIAGGCFADQSPANQQVLQNLYADTESQKTLVRQNLLNEFLESLQDKLIKRTDELREKLQEFGMSFVKVAIGVFGGTELANQFFGQFANQLSYGINLSLTPHGQALLVALCGGLMLLGVGLLLASRFPGYIVRFHEALEHYQCELFLSKRSEFKSTIANDPDFAASTFQSFCYEFNPHSEAVNAVFRVSQNLLRNKVEPPPKYIKSACIQVYPEAPELTPSA